MPAPIAKGPFFSSSSFSSTKTNAAPPGKGLILLTAALIAAGYAVYENRDQVRDFMDRSRRKISFAMHNFSDDIMLSEEERERARVQQQQHQQQQSSPLLRRGRSSTQNSATQSGRELDVDAETLNGDEKMAEGTGRDMGVGNSMIRHRSQHRAAMEDDFETLPEPNKVIFDYATESNPFADPEKVETESSTTLSAIDDEMVPIAEPAPAPEIKSEQDIGAAQPALETASEAPIEQPSTPVPDENISYVPSQPYWSIHEWTQTVGEDNDTADAGGDTLAIPSSEPSLVGGSSDDEDRIDIVSDVESSLDGSWSDVGSDISADDHHH